MVENKIAEIKDGADLATWKDEAEEGRPYAAAIVGGYTYVRVKSRELAEEIAAELESAAELGCDPYVDDELLEAELTKAERLDDLEKTQALGPGLGATAPDVAAELYASLLENMAELTRLKDRASGLLAGFEGGLAEYKQRALELEQEKVDALNRLTEAVRELAPV